MKTHLKSIGAIAAGFLTIVLLSVITDLVFGLFGVFPIMTTFSLLVAFIYRSVYTVIGGYVTAALAPNKPMRHAIILGSIGTVIAIYGVIAGWNLGAHWYPIALALTGLLFTHMGGRIRSRIKTL